MNVRPAKDPLTFVYSESQHTLTTFSITLSDVAPRTCSQSLGGLTFFSFPLATSLLSQWLLSRRPHGSSRARRPGQPSRRPPLPSTQQHGLLPSPHPASARPWSVPKAQQPLLKAHFAARPSPKLHLTLATTCPRTRATPTHCLATLW